MKKILEVKGKGNTGKSFAIRMVYVNLIKQGAQEIKFIQCTLPHNIPVEKRLDCLADCDCHGDVISILQYKEVKIGIFSYGDPCEDQRIAREITTFKENDCDLIVCASRTRGKTCEAIRRFSGSYNIECWHVMKGNFMDADALWQKVQTLVEEIRNPSCKNSEKEKDTAMKRKVWKIGCRWSENGAWNTSIFALFKNRGVVFADTPELLKMKVGDLVAVADGFDVIAIGEVLLPPAQMKEVRHFNQVTDEEWREYFVRDTIHGCAIKRFYKLQENDKFQYPARGMFRHASNIEEKVNSLFEQYEALQGEKA